MKNTRHLIGYSLAIILTFFLTKTCTNKALTDPIIEQELLYRPDDKPKEIIDLCKGQKLYQNYNSRADSIQKYEQENIDNFQASRNITFKYQELVNYFNFIEQITKKAGGEISGLRFYFGKYSSDHEDYPGQQMLFFNPTIQDPDNQKKSFSYAIKEFDDGKYEIVNIDNLDKIDCENPKNIFNKAGLFSFSSGPRFVSLEGQGGQISPPDN